MLYVECGTSDVIGRFVCGEVFVTLPDCVTAPPDRIVLPVVLYEISYIVIGFDDAGTELSRESTFVGAEYVTFTATLDGVDVAVPFAALTLVTTLGGPDVTNTFRVTCVLLGPSVTELFVYQIYIVPLADIFVRAEFA